MLTYRGDESDRFYFANHKRVDERELFNQAKHILDDSPPVTFLEFKLVAYVDIWRGSYKGTNFELWLDINYGPFIICKDEIALKELEQIINAA